jgi:hypothetical protein
MVERLRGPAMFRRVLLSFGAPSRPNGYDLDPINSQMEMKERGLLRKAAAGEAASACARWQLISPLLRRVSNERATSPARKAASGRRPPQVISVGPVDLHRHDIARP